MKKKLYYARLVGGRYDGGSVPLDARRSKSTRYVVLSQGCAPTKIPPCTIEGARARCLKEMPAPGHLIQGLYERCEDGFFRTLKLKSGLGL